MLPPCHSGISGSDAWNGGAVVIEVIHSPLCVCVCVCRTVEHWDGMSGIPLDTLELAL